MKGLDSMMNLISIIHLESEEDFKRRLLMSCKESQAELLEMRRGLKARAAKVASLGFIQFDTPKDKVEFIKECYPRAYRTFVENFPCAVEDPNDMTYLTCLLVDRFIGNMILVEDQARLAFAV